MTRIPMKYLKIYHDRHGKQRVYYRRPGMTPVALPSDTDSKAFRDAYNAARDAEPREIGKDLWPPRSFGALIASYLKSGAYRDLADITRKTYLNDLERFRRVHGKMSVAALKRKHVIAMLDELRDAGKSEKSLRRTLSLLLTLAHERDWRPDNPMTGLRRKQKPTEGFAPWTEDDIAKYRLRWKSGTRERLALELLLCTAQRRADIVTMGRQHARPGKIHVATSKSGGKTRLWIPIHSALQVELKRVPADQLNFLLTQYGKPFTPAGFGNWFGEAARAADLVGRNAHGLRKASLRRLAEAGCTPHQIKAISGHKQLSEVTLYTDSADQERLAEEAMERAEQRTNVSNRPRPVRQKP